jgi:hypothetical protein
MRYEETICACGIDYIEYIPPQPPPPTKKEPEPKPFWTPVKIVLAILAVLYGVWFINANFGEPNQPTCVVGHPPQPYQPPVYTNYQR